MMMISAQVDGIMMISAKQVDGMMMISAKQVDGTVKSVAASSRQLVRSAPHALLLLEQVGGV